MVLDIILIAVIILCGYLGYKHGLVRTLCSVFSWVLSIVVAFLTYGQIASFITASPVGLFIKKSLAESLVSGKTDFSAFPEFLRKPIESGVTEAAVSMSDTLASMIICVISVILTIMTVKLLIKVVLAVLDVFAKLPVIKQFNRLLGIAAGVMNGCIWASIIILALTYLSIIPNMEFLQDILSSSAVAAHIAENSFLAGFFPDA